jgi:DNA-binding NtrC family response regulator
MREGAFTGPDKKYAGAFQRVDRGTLFLDKVGECDSDIQAKLLRVLQPPAGKQPCSREFQTIGSAKTLRTDGRLIAATNSSFSTLSRPDGSLRRQLQRQLDRTRQKRIRRPPQRRRIR